MNVLNHLMTKLGQWTRERSIERVMLDMVEGVSLRATVEDYDPEVHGRRGTPPGYYTVGHRYGHKFVQFYCDDCDGPLTPGPSGGAATNSVCEACRINYGTLPLTLE